MDCTSQSYLQLTTTNLERSKEKRSTCAILNWELSEAETEDGGLNIFSDKVYAVLMPNPLYDIDEYGNLTLNEENVRA